MSRRGQLQPGRPFRHLLLSNLPVSCLESPPAKAGLLLEIETWGTRHPVKSFVSENPEEWRMRKPFVSVGKLGRIGCNLFSFMRLQQKWGRGGGASSFSCPFPRAAGSAWGIRSGGTDDFGLHSSIMRRWIEIICKTGWGRPGLLRNILIPRLESGLTRNRAFWLGGGGGSRCAVCFALLAGRRWFHRRPVRWSASDRRCGPVYARLR